MKAGIILIVIGVVFLLNNLGILTGVTWGIIWPVIFIIIGLGMISGKKCWMRKHWHSHSCDCSEEKETGNQ